ncbi:MAG: alternative ribosome rescue aminoacyl-tRNA hydrolase ArfB [Proteobacteria bacterium]|nr:alternative ribosome rescue aminoacyl-tRNA hydrolase ArfB [Pseudomonadota bacterium]
MKVPKIPDVELAFTFARSSGPGGQNVNKTNSKAILAWNIMSSKSISEAAKARFVEAYGNKINDIGEVIIASDETRDRMQNEARCVEKLMEMIQATWLPPKTRHATKPTKASQRRRVEGKKIRSDVKAGRGRVKSWQ